MRRFIMVTAAAVVVATLGALSPATAGAAGHALRAGSGAPARAGQATSGARLWFRRYNGPANGGDNASSVAVSRDGTRVFVTGTSQDPATQEADYATVAYSAATGRQLWVSRCSVPQENALSAGPVVVSQTRVFVTGTIQGQTTHYVTVAYSAATGRQLWVSRYNYNAAGGIFADSMAVNAAGTAVFVTGSGATVAYDAATGSQLWARHGVGGSVAVNHRGTTVLVTGDSWIVAYNAATGKHRWSLFPITTNGTEFGLSVAFNPAGTVVFVTGTSWSPAGWATEYATTAYNAFHGTQLWARYYTMPGDEFDIASSVVVNPAGTAVFVTGVRGQYPVHGDYATLAYDAATGRKLWVRGYAGATFDQNTGQFVSPALAVSPDGTTVYLTGSSGGYRTLAYNAATGRTLWARHYSANGMGDAAAIAVSPRETAVFVTGTIGPSGDYGTIAYRS